MTARGVVAVDLGAESGRVVLGRFDGAGVALQEVHRFPTPPRPHDGHLRWDLGGLWSHVRDGLAAAGAAAGAVDAVGVDAWGVDCQYQLFALGAVLLVSALFNAVVLRRRGAT